MPETRLMHTYAPPSVTFVSGQGSRLYDQEGREYLDFLCGLAVTSLGHARPEVVEAISAQASQLSHVSNLFGNARAASVAALLDGLLFDATGTHGRVFFCNSGAEANECALKLARRASAGRAVVISTLGSFHGRTLATLAATGQPAKHAPFAPMPAEFVHVPFGEIDPVEKLLGGGEIAAVFVECIQAEGGLNEPPEGYLKELASMTQGAGALFMVDEVQTGLGRTGSWFAFEAEGVVPDVVTMAKALGNGMPVGACWARDEVADAFEPGDHGSTFGGQPLALAAAEATIETMIDLDAPRLASEKGRYLEEGLLDLPLVEGVRGRGLLLGAQLSIPVAAAVVARSLELGLVLNAVRPDTIRLAPALTVSHEEIDAALVILGQALNEEASEGATP